MSASDPRSGVATSHTEVLTGLQISAHRPYSRSGQLTDLADIPMKTDESIDSFGSGRYTDILDTLPIVSLGIDSEDDTAHLQ